ncbi:PREDICTED: uncharacterized protein LOC108358113 [Rhagoletis zephyria]|uniref:uncharacterized protein LOC108358113 n=1 Tax=Rhagoletis zephyria TaxID=28612 RepID=UPI0008117B53|nr:PREDICTED: uncharacterized protein LOC108358113 [Rhagoletis zephyria]
MGTINTEIYVKECLQKRLLPFLRHHNGQIMFWPDLAPAHYANITQKWFEDNNVHYVRKDLNPPNVPELRPIERYWALMKAKLLKMGKPTKTISEIKRMWRTASLKVSPEKFGRMDSNE